MQRLLCSFLLLVAVVGLTVSQPKAQSGKPRLVIVISVDQMKAEYFDWYGAHWNGGLKRLFTDGVVYTQAMLDYASSETGPGHATLSTGSFPRHSGILGNDWIDPTTRRSVYCVEDSTALEVEGMGGGRSPRNLKVTALGDWLKKASSTSRVVSVSIKDRAAILMGGQHPDQAYWYDSKTGKLVTSSYYSTKLAPWVSEFNAANWVQRNLPPVWNKLMPEENYTGPDDQRGEFLWGGSRTFPHPFLQNERTSRLTASPWGDALLMDAARAAVKGEQLGTRGVTDILFLGLSCTDYIGHAFGPNSHEMQDNLARLDASLGGFIADMETVVGKGNLIVTLSADHACMPMPEYTQDVEHKQARRLNIRTELYPALDRLDSLLRTEWGIGEQLFDRQNFINYKAAAAKNITPELLEQRLREGMIAIDGIADVYFKSELSSSTPIKRPYGERFQHSYYAPRGEDFQIRFDENTLVSGYPTGSSHGSVYDYDNHIPLVVWGVPARVNRVSRAAV